MGNEPLSPRTDTRDLLADGFDQAHGAFADAGLDWDAPTLRRLGMIDEEGVPTQLAQLLADDCPFVIKATVFSDDDKTQIKERATLRGSILSQLDQAIAFIRDHEADGPAWPRQAVREALINAIEHRDYSFSGAIMLDVCDGSLDVVSLGGLVGGIKLNDLINGVCQPRDQRLATLLTELGLAEDRGMGIRRIISAYQHSDVAPRISVGPSSVAVSMPRPVPAGFAADGKGTGPGSLPPLTPVDPAHPNVFAFPGARVTHDEAQALAGGSRVVAIAPLDLLLLRKPDWQKELLPAGAGDQLEQMMLDFMQRNSGHSFSRSQLQEYVPSNNTAARKALNHLIEADLVERLGRSRATTYQAKRDATAEA